jgi:hypothetical protein
MKAVYQVPALKTGNLAYLDTFAGLIPCKVLAIDGPSGPVSLTQRVAVRITSPRRGYAKGDIVIESALHVVPRPAVHFRNDNARIGFYHVVGDSATTTENTEAIHGSHS